MLFYLLKVPSLENYGMSKKYGRIISNKVQLFDGFGCGVKEVSEINYKAFGDLKRNVVLK